MCALTQVSDPVVSLKIILFAIGAGGTLCILAGMALTMKIISVVTRREREDQGSYEHFVRPPL